MIQMHMNTASIVDFCLASFEAMDDYLEVAFPILLWQQAHNFNRCSTFWKILDRTIAFEPTDSVQGISCRNLIDCLSAVLAEKFDFDSNIRKVLFWLFVTIQRLDSFNHCRCIHIRFVSKFDSCWCWHFNSSLDSQYEGKVL